MTRYAALLRGINVGGRNQLAMATLREVAEDLGYADVATYVNSGNLFLTTDRDETMVARELRAAIADRTGLDLPVIVRSHTDLVAVIAANPLGEPADPARLFVTFCATTAGLALDPTAFAPESAVARGREIYSWYPDGAGRSPLAAALARKGAKHGTARNWRTVLTLAERTA